MAAIRGCIYGRVQGVGFRYFAQNKAEELGLSGWVRNLSDGSVEIRAQGPLQDVEQFMHYLKVGPVGSRVDHADFQQATEPEDIGGFEIRG
jgi:acylphosphatase